MKVIILTGEPFPNGMAATNRVKCYARAIKERGADCEVLIYRRTERYGQGLKNTEGEGFFAEDIPFRFISGTPLRGSNLLKRQLDDRLDVWRTCLYLKKNLQKGDILLLYMGVNVEIMLCFMKAAHEVGSFCVRDLCELPYGTRNETEKTIRLRKSLLERQFPLLDGIISISDALMNLGKIYSSTKCKHLKVPIMVDYKHYAMRDCSNEVKIPYIFHCGTLYEQKDGILGMLEAFGIARQKLKKPIKYILTGNIEESPHSREIKYLIEKYQIDDSIEFVGYINSEQVKDYLCKASLVISNRPKSKQDYYGFSTKVGEYLASGTPMITTFWGESMNWLHNRESAYIIEPGDTLALANAINHAFTFINEAKYIGLGGQDVCRHNFDYHVWGKPIIEFFKQLGE